MISWLSDFVCRRVCLASIYDRGGFNAVCAFFCSRSQTQLPGPGPGWIEDGLGLFWGLIANDKKMESESSGSRRTRRSSSTVSLFTRIETESP